MKQLCLLFVLALGAAATAQDRASVEAFIHRYSRGVETWDFDGTLAAFDPTVIVRYDGQLITYADLRGEREEAKVATKGRRPPRYVTASVTALDKVEIVGERAIVDFAYRPPKERKDEKIPLLKINMILAWRDGGWKIWRVHMVIAA